MDRSPLVHGQFYPADPEELRRQVDSFLARADPQASGRTLLAMVPHAGYPYSGAIAGATLGQARLAERIVLLGPNHTGRGARLALWPDGAWRFPGASLRVDIGLAAALSEAAPVLSADREAHLGEHSLEVILPFLHRLNPATTIVPIAVAEPRLDVLLELGKALAAALRQQAEPVSLVVSSDMSHFISHTEATRRDRLALDCIAALDAQALFQTVRRHNITMCGVLPMTVGIAACHALGATSATITGYATSAQASGDFDRVVGYAGALVQQ